MRYLWLIILDWSSWSVITIEIICWFCTCRATKVYTRYYSELWTTHTFLHCMRSNHESVCFVINHVLSAFAVSAVQSMKMTIDNTERRTLSSCRTHRTCDSPMSCWYWYEHLRAVDSGSIAWLCCIKRQMFSQMVFFRSMQTLSRPTRDRNQNLC